MLLQKSLLLLLRQFRIQLPQVRVVDASRHGRCRDGDGGGDGQALDEGHRLAVGRRLPARGLAHLALAHLGVEHLAEGAAQGLTAAGKLDQVAEPAPLWTRDEERIYFMSFSC